ncbi:RTX toxin acyltransferase family [Synechococcus sp. PCC 7335]|uniref:toxin-activating lysine-acyltransferase n=1 Tax=Synechococcus sp. (strain ATCC 29403 / PCC 7335) TaxID=91464 RepID=UPI00017EDD0C|nr:toxin-activating lysine-acyltransferase [Synechococcus sp. PCC 7335]EDX84677.1 RTX toxin acyltransferase family [Synechococcus sp. PCC 7335]
MTTTHNTASTIVSEMTKAQSPSSVTIPDNLPNSIIDVQNRIHLLGSLLHLAMHSPLHRRYTLNELEEQFVASLIHGQFRYYEVAGSPVGFVNWAWLTDELAEKYSTGEYTIALNEWQGGSQLWFPEFIAPFGHTNAIVRDLRTHVFEKGTPAKALRISPEGDFKGVSQYRL